jgi:hypothetical protein
MILVPLREPHSFALRSVQVYHCRIMRFEGPCAEVAVRVLGVLWSYTRNSSTLGVPIGGAFWSTSVSANGYAKNSQIHQSLHNNRILYINGPVGPAAVFCTCYVRMRDSTNGENG